MIDNSQLDKLRNGKAKARSIISLSRSYKLISWSEFLRLLDKKQKANDHKSFSK